MENTELFNLYLNQIIDYDDDNKCLISNEELTDNNIELICGHKFNYLPLYYEIFFQKYKQIHQNDLLKINQIRCPYCRTITNNILPFYSIYPVKKINGITIPEKYSMEINKCQYVKKNKTTCNKNAFKFNNMYCCNIHFNKIKLNNEETSLNNNHEKVALDYDINLYNQYKKMKVVELKELLKHKQHHIYGNKETLIKRLLNC